MSRKYTAFKRKPYIRPWGPQSPKIRCTCLYPEGVENDNGTKRTVVCVKCLLPIVKTHETNV